MYQILVSLLVVLTLTQDCVWGQQRYKVENDPFGGVRYSHSRVASTEPRKPPSSNRTSSGIAYRRPVVSAGTTSTTEVPRTAGPWDAYTTQTPQRVRGRYDAYTTTTTVAAYPRGRWDAYTSTSTTPTPPRPVSYREDPYRTSLDSDFDSESVTKKPRRRKLKPITDDSASYGTDADKKQQWRSRYGSWKKNPHVVSNRLRSPYATTAANTEGHGIEEGSYFERSNTSTPGPQIEEDRASHFDWETTKKYPQHHHKKHHRNHHHRTTTTTTTSTAAPSPLVQPDYSDRYRNRDDSYAAFESRSHSYSPSASTSTTVDPYYDAPVTRSTLRPYRRRTTTTTTAQPYADDSARHRLSSHVAPTSSALTGSENAAGSATYHQKLRRKPTAAVQHRSSESVSYVAGSYFPMSAGNDAASSRRSAATVARRPASGFSVRARSSYDADPVTPSPLPTPVYPTVRIHYFAEDSRDDDVDESGGRRHHQQQQHHQQTGRRTYQDDVDNRDEDYSHPFASLAGNYYPS